MILSKQKFQFKAEEHFTSVLSIIEFPPAMESDNLTILFPDFNDFEKSIEYTFKLRKIGTPIPAIDLVIAAMCHTRNLMLISNDAHFQHISSMDPKFRVLSLENFLK